ncbi:DUF4255 domain-containing protein [Chryseobacterium oryctis]|uniref:DUF4255 domain-containing protein n=1 Tax=Chryseobacterium oryctis TaxID=2952618 RepID=A0ABT3HRP2_9FLAO|nr:DUF4255 domain-containing protein [Chryseobacterium oryctis]MCW3162459.1 DUF4255 domain-containing protein [Chryseobacterium oryctis]
MNLRKIIELLCKLVDPNSSIIDTVNISTVNDGDEFLNTKSPIILSIVNIEEDKTLKNQTVYLNNTNDKEKISKYKNPAQYLILSLLFASYNKDMTKYLDGIDKLKNIIVYFQQNNSFYYKDDDTELISYENYQLKNNLEKEHYYKITMETVSLTSEQLNQMWSYLGSKYMPSMLYKMRLCMIQESPIIEDKVIKKVKINLWENDKNSLIGDIESGEFQGET